MLEGINAKVVVKGEAEGTVLYICSEPTAHEFYCKTGFEDAVDTDIKLIKWSASCSGFGMYK